LNIDDGSADDDRGEQNAADEPGAIVFPLRVPAAFFEDIGDAATLEVVDEAFDHVDAVCKQQR
jgi:hypothetical protein